MRRDLRLTSSQRFSELYQEGRGWANSHLVLKALPNGLGYTRFGLVAGKRVGKAVVRNTVKRRLREILRSTPAQPGWDMVFIARTRAPQANYQQLKAAAEDLLRRARLLDAATTRNEPRK